MQKTCLDGQCFTVRVVRCVKWTSGPTSSVTAQMIFIDYTEKRGNASTPESRVQIQMISTNSGNSLKQSGGHLRGKNALGNSSSSTNTRWGTSNNQCKHWEFVVDHRLNKSDKTDIAEKRQASRWGVQSGRWPVSWGHLHVVLVPSKTSTLHDIVSNSA